MATSSILGGERAGSQAEGRDMERFGPSDSSDSGSDVQGELDLVAPEDPDQMVFGATQPGLRSTTDAAGTGERGSALVDEEAREGSDLLPDQVQNLAGDDGPGGELTEAELELIEKADVEDWGQQDLGDPEEEES